MTFTPPTTEERAEWLRRLDEAGAHDAIASGLACLSDVDEVGSADPGARAGTAASGWLRVAAWNAERGRFLEGSIELLARVDADVVLLSELDSGMARSGNADVPRRLAETLGYGGAFGVEFIELGLGDAAEEARMLSESGGSSGGGAVNERGLHGNAVLARGGVREAVVLRLDAGGDWFGADRGQPRIGGRMAVAGRVALAGGGEAGGGGGGAGVDVTVVSVHLESSSTAAGRAAQMEVLLGLVDERFGKGPAVIGGDFNTFGAPIVELLDRDAGRRMRAESPTRFSWPVPHEPLFGDVAAVHGFEWVDANVTAPTTRHGAGGLPDHIPLKLDWLLVRGLEARRATVVPALAADGSALSDHDLVAVSVRLR